MHPVILRSIAATAAMAIGATLLVPGQAAMAQAPSAQMAATGPVLSLSVSAAVDSAPDVATVNTGIQTRALTARDAMRLNAQQMDKLIAAIVAAGIDNKDIQTSGISLNAQYDYSDRTGGQPPRFTGYEASNQVTVKIRRIDRAGEIIDRMVTAGATNINGPSFGILDDALILRQAREQAIRTAQDRAQFYAQQTGYRSARLLAISETGGFSPPVPMPMMVRTQMADTESTKIAPGQLSVSVTLNFQYQLER